MEKTRGGLSQTDIGMALRSEAQTKRSSCTNDVFRFTEGVFFIYIYIYILHSFDCPGVLHSFDCPGVPRKAAVAPVVIVVAGSLTVTQGSLTSLSSR